MHLNRRAFLAACLAATGAPVWASPTGSRPEQSGDLEEFPWAAMRRVLRDRFPDLRRHFAFEYYPWYANDPFRHWQQWGREPPTDLAATSMPLLGAYDSRAAAVIEQHARWIVESRVGVVDLSWWGPGSFSDRAVSLVMDVMHAHDIEVTFHMEPYGPHRVEHFPLDVRYLLREYGTKRRWDCFHVHRRADGTEGPVFKLFATTRPAQEEDCHGTLQDVAAYAADSRWRWATDRVREEQAGVFPHVTLLSDDIWAPQRVYAAGFDGMANYDPSIEPVLWLQAAVEATRLGMVFSFNVNSGMDLIERRKTLPDACPGPQPFVPISPGLDWSRSEDRERAAQLGDHRIRDTFEQNLWLQTHPWLGNFDAGFFLTYITSFNEWHEGTQFEPMKAAEDLTPAELAVGYHNPRDGFYRLRRLTELVGRLA